MRVFVIAGPTSVGKSELAVRLAELCGGEIVGADAFQIYQGLRLLTAQPDAESRARVPHHLIGEVPLRQAFDVAQYRVIAQRRIEEIRARGRLPIVVGGTGLYVRALMRGLADLPAADAGLRRRLSARTLKDLQSQLAELDPEGARTIDGQNPRRVVRALEVCLLTGRPFSSFREQWAGEPNEEFRGVLLVRGREDLHGRIDARVEGMFRAGVVEEVASCGEIGATAQQALGRREIQALLDERMSREECIAAIQRGSRRYAKRQMTWFRKEPSLAPISAGAPDGLELMERLIQAAQS